MQWNQYYAMLDDLDLQFFPLRNKPREEAEAGSIKVIVEARQKLKSILQPKQSQRLSEMLLWRVGIFSVVQDDVAEKLGYTQSQRQRLEDILAATGEAAADIEKKVRPANRGNPRKKAQRHTTPRQKKLLETVETRAADAWQEMLGPSFDTAGTRPGEVQGP